MQTSDAGLLFQSDSAQSRVAARERKAARPLFAGLSEPIQVSKPLAVQLQGDEAWVAEASFSAKKVDLKSGKTRKIFKGHAGPVTAVTLLQPSERKRVLVTGAWDKTIRFFDCQTAEQLGCIQKAHTDFVKSLLILKHLELLVSGGSDKDVRLWDLRGFTDAQTPPFLASLRSHTRPVDCLASLPLSQDACSLWTADSMGRVCVWRIQRSDDEALNHSLLLDWRPHETAITSLSLFTFPDEPSRSAEMWTSSADNSVQLHLFNPSDLQQEPTLRLRIPHPDVVRTLWPDYEERLLFTGSADEAIRVWDLEELLSAPPPRRKGWTEDKDTALLGRALVAEVDEHFHDVHILAPYARATASGELEPCLLSGSLDGTLRIWTLKQLQEWNTKGRPAEVQAAEEPKPVESLLSAEEEAELDELLAD